MQMHDPAHPGEIIRELCLEPLKLSVTDAAKALGVTRKALSELLNGRSGVSPVMALRLAKAFDTSAESWMAMQQQLPEVTGMTHLTGNRLTVMVGSHLYSDPVYVADPSFFQIIKLPLVEGSPSSAFSQPNSIVLSQTQARKYFGDADPFGKILILSEKRCDDARGGGPAQAPCA